MVLLLWCQIVLLWHQITMVASEQHLFQTIVQFDKTVVLPRKLAKGSIHDYLFCYCPLLGILFEVLRIACALINSICINLWNSGWACTAVAIFPNKGVVNNYGRGEGGGIEMVSDVRNPPKFSKIIPPPSTFQPHAPAIIVDNSLS